MPRRLNVPFLLKVIAVALAAGIGIHFLHAFQFQRQAESFLEMAEEAETGKDSDKALTYYQHYLSIRPEDSAVRAKYALALELRARTAPERSRAVQEMEKVLAEDPTRAPLRFRLIQNLIALNRVKEAIPHVEKLLPDWPDPAEMHHIHGWCLEAVKNYLAAAAAFERAVQRNPARISSWEIWAEVLLCLPAPDEDPEKSPEQQARSVMDRMVSANPKDFQAYLARFHFLNDRAPEQGKEDLDQAMLLGPDQPAVLLAAAGWHLGRGDLKNARSLVERGREKHPKNIALVKALAGLEIRAGRPDKAIDLLRGAQGDLPPVNDLAVLLVELLLDRGELEEAGTRLTTLRGAGLEPRLADFLKARLAIQNKDWMEALALLEPVRANLGDRSEWQGRVHALLGLCHQRLGDTEQQLASFQKAVLREPGWPEARLGLASALSQAGRTNEALALFRELLREQKSPGPRLAGLDVLHARALLGQILFTPGKDRDWSGFDQALRLVEENDPGVIELPLLRAEAFFARNDYPRAEEVLAQARASHPKEPAFWSLAADLAARRNQFDHAEQILAESQKHLGDRLEVRLDRIRLWGRQGGPDAGARLPAFTAGTADWPSVERAQLLRALAEIVHRLGATKEAAGLWEQLAAREPRDLRSRVGLLEIALERGDLVKAGEWIEQLRALEGEQGKWWRSGRAALFIREGKDQPAQWTEAAKALDHLALHQRDWSRIALLRARLAEAQGKPEAALTHYGEALRLGELDMAAVLKVVAELAARKRFLDADQVLVQWETRAPLPPELSRLGTQVAFGLGSPEKARARALQAFNLNADDYRTQTWLVGVYHALGEEEQAEALARRAVAANPHTPDPWITLVRQLAFMGKRDEAVRLASACAAKVPTPAAPYTMARAYEALGDLEKAEASFLQGLKEQPDEFILAMQAADFFLRVDKPFRAIPILQELLQPTSPAPREFLPRLRRQLAVAWAEDPAQRDAALALLNRNGKPAAESPANQRARAFVLGLDPSKHAEAVKLFQDSLKRAPALDEETYLLVRIHEAAGKALEALAILEPLVQYQPENPQFLARLVRLLAAQERSDEARTYLRRLERLEAEGERALALRKMLDKI